MCVSNILAVLKNEYYRRSMCSDHLFDSAEVVQLSDHRIVQVNYEQIPLEISREKVR